MSLLGHSLFYPLLYLLVCISSIFAENAPANANGIQQQQNSNCNQNMNSGSRPQLMTTLLNIAQSKGILSDIQPALEPLLTNQANIQDLAQIIANLPKDRQKVSNRQGEPSRTLINLSSLQPSQTDISNQNNKVPPTLKSGSLQLISMPPTGVCEQKSRQLQLDTSNRNSVVSCKSVNSPSLNVLQPVNLPSPMISTSNVVYQNSFNTSPKQDVPYTFPQKSSYQPITFQESLPTQSSVVQEVKLTPQNIQINKIDPVVPCQNIAAQANYVIQQQSPNSDCTQNINNGPGSQLMSTLLNIAQSKGILSDILPVLGPLLNTQNNLQDIAQIVANLPKDKQKIISGQFQPREISISASLLNTQNNLQDIAQIVANLPKDKQKIISGQFQPREISISASLSQPLQTEVCSGHTNIPIVCESLLPTKSPVVQEVNLMPQNIQANKINPVVSCKNVATNPNYIIQQQLPNSDSVQNINNGPGPQLMNTLLNIAQAKGILPDILPALAPLLNCQNNLQDMAQIVANLPQEKQKIVTGKSQARGISSVSPPSQLVQKEVSNPNTIVYESTPTTQTRQVQEVNLMPQNIQANKINPVVSCKNFATNPNYIIQQQLPNSDSVQNINNGPGPQLMNTLLNIAQAKGILPDILPALAPLLNCQNNLQDMAQIVANLPQEKQKIVTGKSQARGISTVSPSSQLVQKEVCNPNTIVYESTPTTQTRQVQEVNLMQQNILPNKMAPVLPCTNNVASRPNTEIVPQNTVISDESLQVPLNLHITLPPPNIPAPRIAILSPSSSCGCDPSIKCACSPSSSCDYSSPSSQISSCQTALCKEGQPPPQTVPYSPAPVINPMLPIIVNGGRGNRDNSFEYLLPILFLSLLRNGGYGGNSRYGGNSYGSGGSGFCSSNNCGYGNSYGCNCPYNCGCPNFPPPLPFPLPNPYCLQPDDSVESDESCEE